MKIITFDVETIPDYTRRDIIRPIILERLQVDKPHLLPEAMEQPSPEKIQAQEAEVNRIMSITPEYCKLVCLGYTINEDAPHSGVVGYYSPIAGGEPLYEADLLKTFWKLVVQADHIIGYNILNFDLQVIRARSARLGIKPTRALWDVKPWESVVIDVWAKRWPSGSKGVRGRKLDQIAEVERIPIPEQYRTSEEFTGADVLTAYQKGDLESIGTHCELDVIKCRELARLWGGVFMPQVFLPHDGWDYETGEWVGEPRPDCPNGRVEGKPEGW